MLKKALTSPQSRERDKARIVLKASEGLHSIVQLSELTGRASMTIQRWLAKWRRGGIAELMQIGRGPGKSPRVSRDVQEELKNKLCEDVVSIKGEQDWFVARGIQLTYAGTYYWVEKLKRIVKVTKPVRAVKKPLKTSCRLHRKKLRQPLTLARIKDLG